MSASDTRTTLQRTNQVLDTVVEMLTQMADNQTEAINADKDRKSYKEGLVDGLCMMSWEGEEVDGVKYDYVGEANEQGTGKLLSEVLVEIGSVYGFDGEAELKRVKNDEIDDENKPELKEVTDEDLNEDDNNG